MSPAGGETMVKPTVIQALNVLDKKIRNLEKRRAKLDLLRGAKKELDLEQQKALTKYDEVILLLENYKESRDQVNKIIAEEAKNKIKQEKMEKEEKLKADISKVSFVLSVNRLFDLILSSDGQELVKEAAPQLNGKPLELLLEFAELVMSGISSGDELQMNEVLEHLVYLADNKNKRSAKYLYKALRESVDILLDSGLWHPRLRQTWMRLTRRKTMRKLRKHRKPLRKVDKLLNLLRPRKQPDRPNRTSDQ